jgi:hypothetical protein
MTLPPFSSCLLRNVARAARLRCPHGQRNASGFVVRRSVGLQWRADQWSDRRRPSRRSGDDRAGDDDSEFGAAPRVLTDTRAASPSPACTPRCGTRSGSCTTPWRDRAPTGWYRSVAGRILRRCRPSCPRWSKRTPFRPRGCTAPGRSKAGPARIRSAPCTSKRLCSSTSSRSSRRTRRASSPSTSFRCILGCMRLPRRSRLETGRRIPPESPTPAKGRPRFRVGG